VSRYQKGKTNLDFTEARDSEWQWHQLGICKSAPRSRQIITPAPHLSVFTGRMPFLPPNQQCQSTEGTNIRSHNALQFIGPKHIYFQMSIKFSIASNMSQSSQQIVPHASCDSGMCLWNSECPVGR